MQLLGMNLAEWLSVLLILSGVIAMLLSSVGILRMPDMYTRLHAATQARTLGVGALFLSVAAHDWTIIAAIKMLLFVGLFLLSTPVTAHILARAAYRRGIRRTAATHIDELAEVYQNNERRQP
jgi:multicomponent Na+:H+ antiporter subunit G